MTVRRVTVDRHGFHLVKDLRENEQICTTCKGLGLVILDYPYGITGERRTDGKAFPYNKQYVGFCPQCYVGVQTLCEHCGRPHQKHNRQCLCDGARAEQDRKFDEKERAKAEKATKLTVPEAIAQGIEMVYSDGLDRYIPIDELEDLDEEDAESTGIVWATSKTRISFDASDIVDNACEDLHEGARDNITGDEVKELQAHLDEWAEKYGKYTTTYLPDYKYVIEVDLPSETENAAETTE